MRMSSLIYIIHEQIKVAHLLSSPSGREEEREGGGERERGGVGTR
jgi:hypothetical protein